MSHLSHLSHVASVNSTRASISQQNQALLNHGVPNLLPLDIWMSHDPFDAVISVQIDLKGHTQL
jgi:hypothetical protein